jgi:hypothetical protein
MCVAPLFKLCRVGEYPENNDENNRLSVSEGSGELEARDVERRGGQEGCERGMLYFTIR